MNYYTFKILLHCGGYSLSMTGCPRFFRYENKTFIRLRPDFLQNETFLCWGKSNPCVMSARCQDHMVERLDDRNSELLS